MPWKEPGKGGQDPWKQGNQPPDLDEVFQNLQSKVRSIFGGGGGSEGGGNAGGSRGSGGIVPLLLVLLVFWAAWDSVHIVDEAERGVVLRFGAYTREMPPGINLALPRPFETVQKVNISSVRTVEDRGNMLTEDENLVDFAYQVQFRVNDPKAFLFQVRDAELTLAQAAESALRESVGTNRLDNILEGTTREAVRFETRRVLQETLDRYQAGIFVTEFNLVDVNVPAQVREAYSDVIRAREDRERFIEEARAHANSVIPASRGQAARVLQEAQGYRDATVALAEGEADRFLAQLLEYARAPEITRKRMYLEAMEGVLSASSKLMLDAQSQGNILYLPLSGAGGNGSAPIPPLLTPDGLDSTGADRGNRTPRTVNREARQ